jgi:predicted molibdopterin-dependent oxidoreductase YjgC
MIRVDGALREVDWNVALDYVSHALKDVVGSSGGESLAALASPQATLEELYLLQKLTRGLGSGSVDFRPRRRDFSPTASLAAFPGLASSLSEIKDLDAAWWSAASCARTIRCSRSVCVSWPRNGARSACCRSSGDDPLINCTRS